MDRAYKIVAVFLVCIVVLSLGGCRQRTTCPTPPSAETAQNQPDNQEQQESTEGEAQDSPSEETETQNPPDTPPETPKINAQDDSRVPENLESPSDDSKQSNTQDNPNSDQTANTGDPNGDNSATEVDPIDDNGETTIDPEGDKVQIIVDQYTDLLEQGKLKLYACQQNNVYFETVTDYLTVGKGSPEHQIILDSGGANVADMRMPNALNVDDAWVIKMNPGTIVKCVDASVLGSAVHDTTAAAQTYSELCSRPGWDGVNAVMYGNVVLLSEELFETDEGRLAAKLYIASAMYPTLFANVDLNAYCTTIFGENCGIYAYTQ